MAKIDHIPDEPTQADIVVLLKKIHDCMEQRFTDSSMIAATIAGDAASAAAKAETAAAKAESAADAAATVGAKVEKITQALGLDESGAKKPAGMSSGWQAWKRTFLATTSSIAAVGIAVRLGVALWPSLNSAWAAVVHAALTGKF